MVSDLGLLVIASDGRGGWAFVQLGESADVSRRAELPHKLVRLKNYKGYDLDLA